jgi:hypothetical protein
MLNVSFLFGCTGRTINCIHQVINAEQLILVVAGADDGNAVAFANPLEENLEDAEPPGADESLGANDRHINAILLRDVARFFRRDF